MAHSYEARQRARAEIHHRNCEIHSLRLVWHGRAHEAARQRWPHRAKDCRFGIGKSAEPARLRAAFEQEVERLRPIHAPEIDRHARKIARTIRFFGFNDLTAPALCGLPLASGDDAMTDTAKAYTNRQNAIRAARKALGPAARVDVDFAVADDGGSFAWAAIVRGAAVEIPADLAGPVEIPADLAGPVEIPADLAGPVEIPADLAGPVEIPAFTGDLDCPLKAEAIARIARLALGIEDLAAVPQLRKALDGAYEAGFGACALAQPSRAKPKADRKPREGNKRDLVAGLLLKPEGTTNGEILEVTGWPSVSVPQQARASGLELRQEREAGKPTRYYGSRPVAA